MLMRRELNKLKGDKLDMPSFGLWNLSKQMQIPIDTLLSQMDLSGGFTGEDFLRGFCNMLALRLHELYGYPMYKCVTGDRMVHTYCKADGYYLDIRGGIRDEETFFACFDTDETTTYDIPVQPRETDDYGVYEKISYDIIKNSGTLLETLDLHLPHVGKTKTYASSLPAVTADKEFPAEFLEGEWRCILLMDSDEFDSSTNKEVSAERV